MNSDSSDPQQSESVREQSNSRVAPPNRPPHPKPRIPDHELLRCIGFGSYGEVWLARNVMGVHRAVKVVYRDTFDSDKPYDREFEGIRKFEPVSRSHESQVDILHVGRNDEAGYFYYVMELADDARHKDSITPADAPLDVDRYEPKTLHSELARHERIPIPACLDLALGLTTALEHLHKNELVHRDIKPSNVIFVNDVPKLADIGLVAQAEATLSIVGTAGYMPPEGPGRPQADIYSLGKVLYEMATGKDRTKFPEPPTRIQDREDRELFLEFNEAVLKACQASPDARYQSAGEMHEDLLLLRAGKSLKRSRLLEKRFAQAKKVGLAFAAISAIAVAGYFYQESQTQKIRQLAIQEAEQRRTAEQLAVQEAEQRQAAEAARLETEEALRREELLKSNQLLESGQSGQALAMLAARLRADPEDSFAAQRLLSALTYRNFAVPLAEFRHDPALKVSGADVSPDGRWLVAISIDPVNLNRDGYLSIWDLESKTLIRRQAVGRFGGRFDHPNIDFDPTRNRFVVPTGWTKAVQIWQISDEPQLVLEIPHEGPVFHAEFSPDSSRIVTTTHDGADIRDSATGETLAHLPHVEGPQPRVVDIGRFTADGDEVITVSAGLTCAWDSDTGELLNRLRAGYVTKRSIWKSVALHSTEPRLIHQSGQNPFHLLSWDYRTDQSTVTDDFHQYPILALAVSPSGRMVASGANDQTLRLWDWGSSLSVRHVTDVPSPLFAAAFSPNGEMVAGGSRNGTIRLFSKLTAKPICEPFQMGNTVLHLAFTPDGASLLSFDLTTVRLWDIRPGGAKPNLMVPDHRGGSPLMVGAVAYDQNGKTLVTSLADRFFLGYYRHGPKRGLHPSSVPLQRWNVRSGKPTLDPNRLDSLSRPWLSEDATFTFDVDGNEARLLFTESGEEVLRFGWRDRLEGQDGRALCDVSHDHQWLVTATESNRMVKVWNLATPEVQHTLTFDNTISRVRFTPDSMRIFIGFGTDACGLYEVQSGEEVAFVPAGFPGFDIRFSPDSRLLALRSGAGARVYSATTLDPLSDWVRHEEVVVRARFSHDSRYLLTASMDRSVKVWDVSSDRLDPDRRLEQVAPAFTHGWVISDARFSPNDEGVGIASWDTTARVWSRGLGRPLSEPLPHPDVVLALDFDPGGRWLATGCADGVARIWEIPQAPGPAPEWLPELAEALAGYRVNEASGDLERIGSQSADLLLDIRGRVLSEALSADEYYSNWVRWFFADRATRSISPLAEISMETHLRQLARMDSPELPLRNDVPERISHEELLQLVPMEPRYLARTGHKLVAHSRSHLASHLPRADWLTRLAVQLDPGLAMGWWARAEVFEARGRLNEAREAIRKALALDPTDPNAWLAQALILHQPGQEAEAYAAFKKAAEIARSGGETASGQAEPYLDPMLRLLAVADFADPKTLKTLTDWTEQPDRSERYRLIGDWITAWSKDAPSSE